MRSRAVRWTLTVLAIAAIAAAAYMWFTLESRNRTARQAAAAFDRTRLDTLRNVHELRSAQQAYVASGQSEAFWFARVTAASESLATGIATLRASTTSQPALTALQEATAAVEEFHQIDRRARNYTSGGQKLLASDVIFSDGLEATERIIASLDQAGTAAAGAWTTAVTNNMREKALIAGGAAAFAVLTLLLLVPIAATPAPVAQEREPVRVADDRSGLGLRAAGREVAAPRVRPPAPAPAAAPAPAPAPAQAVVSAAPSVEIQGLATLCTDLARLSDTSLLPGILERTAAALDASGLVLWISGPEAKELLPIAAHGYPASALSRMGSLKADGENATAAAFRTGLLQTVGAGGGANGAIAVPLLTATGCRGVMSAEVRNGAEKQPARLAAASIVAAQLATLVGPPPAAEAEGRAAV